MSETATTNKAPEVGDILYSSWGYDQTNIDFYKIVRATDKSVWIQKIGSRSVEGSQGFMSCNVVPDPDVVLEDKATVHRIRFWRGELSLHLTSYSSAYPYEGTERGVYSSWYA